MKNFCNKKNKLLFFQLIIINIYNLSLSLENMCNKFIRYNSKSSFQLKHKDSFYNFRNLKIKKFASKIQIDDPLVNDSKGKPTIIVPLDAKSRFVIQDEYQNNLRTFTSKSCIYNNDYIKIIGQDDRYSESIFITYNTLGDSKHFEFHISSIIQSFN